MTPARRIEAMRDVVGLLDEAVRVTDPIDTLSAIRVEEALLRVRAWLAAREGNQPASEL